MLRIELVDLARPGMDILSEEDLNPSVYTCTVKGDVENVVSGGFNSGIDISNFVTLPTGGVSVRRDFDTRELRFSCSQLTINTWFDENGQEVQVGGVTCSASKLVCPVLALIERKNSMTNETTESSQTSSH